MSIVVSRGECGARDTQRQSADRKYCSFEQVALESLQHQKDHLHEKIGIHTKTMVSSLVVEVLCRLIASLSAEP